MPAVLMNVPQFDPWGGQKSMADILASQANTQARQIQNQYLAPELQQQLLAAQLANQKSQTLMPYVGPQAAAELAYKQAQTPYIQAQTGLVGQQAKYYGDEAKARIAQQLANAGYLGAETKYMPYKTASALDPITQLIAGKQLRNELLRNQNIQQQNAQSPEVNSLVKGISGVLQNQIPQVSQAPQSPQISGAQYLQETNAPMQASSWVQQPINYNDLDNQYLRNQLLSMGKNPMFGSAKSGAGGTFYNPETGETISTPTGQTTSRGQRVITGIENVQSYLEKALKTVPEFLTAGQKANLMIDRIGNLLGGNYESPSNYAQGQANIKSAAEGFINAFGLNATNENVNKAIDIMQPLTGESKKGYMNRIKEQLADFKDQRLRAEGKLAQGFNVSQSRGVSPQSISIPPFENKSQFQNWYKRLSDDQKRSVRVQLGER